jgi:putative flippase GtrA
MDRKKTNSLIQFISFNIIGMLNTALAMGIYFLVVYLGGHYSFALFADYAFGICFGFFMNKHFTFRVRSGATVKMFSKMVFTYGLLFLVNLALLTCTVEFIGCNEYAAQIISFCCLMVVSFFVQKMFVFRVANA